MINKTYSSPQGKQNNGKQTEHSRSDECGSEIQTDTDPWMQTFYTLQGWYKMQFEHNTKKVWGKVKYYTIPG